MDLEDIQRGLRQVAERSLQVAEYCQNEESTKLYLVLPFLSLLGYDCANPLEVQPEYLADYRDYQQEKVDFAVVLDGRPTIAVECKRAGIPLEEHRGQLRGYYGAIPSFKLGVLTNGLVFEFFVDSENENIMDTDPFLTIDLESVHRSGVPEEMLGALALLSKSGFSPGAIAQEADLLITKKRLRALLLAEARAPSEEFCRHLLQRAGLSYIRRAAIEQHYSALVRSAFEEALIVPVIRALRASTAQGANVPERDENGEVQSRIYTTERELAVYKYVKRRLAYLSPDDHHFNAIEYVEHRDYIGKFSIFYRRERKGRILDFIEGGDGYDKYVFPEPLGEIVTNNPLDIDDALRETFTARVRELGGISGAATRQGRISA